MSKTGRREAALPRECRQAREALVTGSADGVQRASSVDEHLSRCPKCGAFARRLTHATEVLQADRPPVPEQVPLPAPAGHSRAAVVLAAAGLAVLALVALAVVAPRRPHRQVGPTALAPRPPTLATASPSPRPPVSRTGPSVAIATSSQQTSRGHRVRVARRPRVGAPRQVEMAQRPPQPSARASSPAAEPTVIMMWQTAEGQPLYWTAVPAGAASTVAAPIEFVAGVIEQTPGTTVTRVFRAEAPVTVAYWQEVVVPQPVPGGG